MKRRTIARSVALLSVFLLAGCESTPNIPEDNMTWQDAKLSTQATEMELARLLPPTDVISVDQRATGRLFSCDETRHQWVGMTTIQVAPSADLDALITATAARFDKTHDGYEVRESLDVNDHLRVQLVAANGEESYLLSRGADDGTIEVASGSLCFTLPNGTYPGGKF